MADELYDENEEQIEETGQEDEPLAEEPAAEEQAGDPEEDAVDDAEALPDGQEDGQEDEGVVEPGIDSGDVAGINGGLSLDRPDVLTPAVIDRGDELGSLNAVLGAALTAVNASYQALTELQYSARTWVDDTSVGPWLNATNLNSMDGMIEDLTDAVNQLNTNCEALKDDLEDLGESVSSIPKFKVYDPSRHSIYATLYSFSDGQIRWLQIGDDGVEWHSASSAIWSK